MSAPRILLLYNQPVLPPGHPESLAEVDVLETVDVVAEILQNGGMEVVRYGLGADLHPLHHVLGKEQPDAVFNLFEGLADRPFTESVVAGILEWENIPFTGCPSECLTICRDKQRSKLIFQGAGLPTAPFVSVDSLPAPQWPFEWPVMVKPARQDASVGIDQGSVVTNQGELESRVERVLSQHGTVMVERYVAGREFMISLVEVGNGNDLLVLPLAELAFNNPSIWPIYSYNAKWEENSVEYQSVPIVVPVAVEADWRERMEKLAKQAYRLLGCRDYARLDLRMTAAGEPFILEMNPNPFLNSLLIVEGLKAINREYDRFVLDLAEAALARRTPVMQEAS